MRLPPRYLSGQEATLLKRDTKITKTIRIELNTIYFEVCFIEIVVFYRGYPLEETAREEQLPVRQHGHRTQQVEDGVADSAAHERDFGAVAVGHVTAHHRCQYVPVQERAQHAALCRRVPLEFAVLQRNKIQFNSVL